MSDMTRRQAVGALGALAIAALPGELPAAAPLANATRPAGRLKHSVSRWCRQSKLTGEKIGG